MESERGQRGLGRRARLLEEHALGPPETGVGLLAGVADRGQTDAAELGERAHHVEHDAGLASLVEVQALANRDVEEVVDPQGP